tara:strand:+ start:1459 stop:2568 length:1110 start_codon:yes stop_codon:yes gene_type:complete
MRKLLILLVVLFTCGNVNAQFIKKFFKYSTLYVSGNLSQPLQEPVKEWYVTQNGELAEITEIYPFNYTVSIGIRKMARFDYEQKPNIFYDGSEENVGWKTNVGAVQGWEYEFSKDWVRNQGDEYTNQNYFLRYFGKYWVGHVKFLEAGIVDLRYAQADLRGRLSIFNHFNLTAGAVVRTHGPYGYNPISIYLSENYWWDLAYEAGYEDQYYTIIDYTNWPADTTGDWEWKDPEGNQIASTDEEFRRYYYSDIINDFNAEKMSEVGTMITLSAAVGLDIYKYTDKFWIHAWANLLPYHKHIYGDPNFSYGTFISKDPEGDGSDQWFDYNCGLNMGIKLGKHFGFFVESDYLRYWDRTVYSAQAGINYLIF